MSATGDAPSRPRRARAFAGRAILDPMSEFLRLEAAGSLVLLAATIVALVWANSPWDGAYRDLWATELSAHIGGLEIEDHLAGAVNDGLMAVFFFVVGLEIKRELVRGELREVRKASLPAIAAIGGMVVPALIFVALNAGGDGARGWGIPMATDIAFAVGILALAGRVPTSLKVFLLALAIVDDLGAIAVIAIFYTEEIALDAGAIAVALVALVFVLQRVGVRSVWPYVIAGVALWVAVFESGVHATVAGVALGLLTPAWPLGDDDGAESPLERLERMLHPWVSFGIVPLFALANAGVALSGDSLSAAAESRVAIGIVLGLVAGKTAGILLATWLAVRTGAGSMPAGARWPQIAGVAMLGGVGFTVSLFVTGLAFDAPALAGDAKLGVFAGSLVAGVLGFTVVRLTSGSTVSTEPVGGSRRSG